MLLLYVLLITIQLVAAIPLVTKRGLAFDYQNDKLQGVNLGGWFVLEPFITPSLFDAFGDNSNTPVDEYNYCSTLGKDECLSRLTDHWSSWYTEDDFKAIKDAGLNAVRIPIGYWAFKMYDYDPYVSGQQDYLDKALEWCRNQGLYAWIDLHGAPGSQNGFDNSGWRDHLEFQSNEYNQALTLDVLKIIMDKYAVDDYLDVVIGIELLNEPLGNSLDLDELKSYLTQGYTLARNNGIQAVVIHDAFEASGYWDDFLTVDNGDYWNVVVDHHHYQVFSAGELERDINTHISTACALGTQHLSESHWNIVGEWSGALTDCARWLNGAERGARWSGDYDSSPYLGSCDPYTSFSNWPDDYKVNVRKYIEAQLDAYSTRAGWFFWTWKTEDAIEWDMSQLIANGIFPQPLSDRQYPNQCGY
ncbi:exo-1,3-beta-glucanase [Yamadazyma tenuis]|uniref:Glucan 1,3-beta-glucosidase n=1 Tax=Candida tenuis (strain ATCC 10573 / BCRC 21748 / CBS 615 / JCM 9827 / NBRC 10315 / NRRL Y-1498 / VKM Y-70) TaxID=590646 RepID=G3B7H4_CANTC|nr:uncharacterized protein CANTEDRAFT_115735 [Yamadazyma tenuis ATCC 10573]XP_006688448.1 glucan 1,3-beta-glucosidase [Yamadazyma tenuis ATCC 10573]EGV62277.1 hypothetical protein CANTEDRAFT_115735 [Yamadazyma tenuis ATCC 10573]EGV62278.1 glucan 1,3-beta-glucosidase [Yamadazyma tenuis ATCC 10573]WEJ93534.1 exo-1,3-beta-glucanase [Yamadazyma tenuis]